MQLKKVLLGVICILCMQAGHAFARQAPSGNTGLSLDISPIDPSNRQGPGNRHYSLSPSNSIWNISTRDTNNDGFVDFVQIQIRLLQSQGGLPEGAFLFFTFSSARIPSPLAPGFYAGAMQAGREAAGHPGLSVGNTCSPLTGEFTILEANYQYDIRFAARFKQQCVGYTGFRTGTVYFNSTGISDSVLRVQSTSPLPDTVIGKEYSYKLEASGGTQPYEWLQIAGHLSPGLRLDKSGLLTGTATAPGTFTFIAEVTDTSVAEGYPNQTSQATFSLTVKDKPLPLLITSPGPPKASKGVSYSHGLASEGGVPPYVWSVVEGQLPPGLNLTPEGQITGIPTEAGSFNVSVEVADSSSMFARQSYTLVTIDPPRMLELRYRAKKRRLTITGEMFNQEAKLYVDGQQITPTYLDTTSIVVKKLSLAPGTHDVRIMNPDGGISTKPLEVE